MIKEVTVTVGSIRNVVSCTGTVLPKNRLEIKPPVSGRIEKILVQEGQQVKTGENLAIMSSTERAALLDAARGKGDDTLRYWQDTYKPIPLLSPIDGEVIVAKTQPGQTVTTSDAVVVLSDHLIVRAQVDETDIGKITGNMKAIITLDAYPDIKISARVEHIYYESETVNNVTVYLVDLIPDEISAFFRSGMNAAIDFIIQNKENTLLLPQEAVYTENSSSYVLMQNADIKELVTRPVTLGLTQDKFVEIVSGLSAQEKVVIKTKKYSLPKSSSLGKNPFLPSRKQAASGKKSGSMPPPP